MIKILQNISAILIAVLCCALGYASAQSGSMYIEDFSPAQLTHRLEQEILKSETAIDLYYNNPLKAVKSQIQNEIPKLLKSNYLCSKLLQDMDAAYDLKKGYTHVRLKLVYGEDVHLPIVVAENRNEMMQAMINGWTAHRGKVTILLKKQTYTEDQFFSLMDTAEINSAYLPCEAQQVLYEEFPKEGDWQIVRMWLGFAEDEKKLVQKQGELSAKIREYGDLIAARNLPTMQEKYRAVYDCVSKAAEYDESIAFLSQAKRLGGEMYLNRSAYGALVSGKTVCNGYSRAFKAICDYLQMPCWVVSGSKDGVKHTWNVVTVQGQRYFVDCTFASTGTRAEDTFLLKEERLDDLGYVLNDYFVIPESM